MTGTPETMPEHETLIPGAPAASATAPAADPAPDDPLTTGFRRLLGAIVTIGVVGTLIEMILLEHWDEPWQLVPIVLLGLGVLAVPVAVLAPRRWNVLSLRWLMGAYVLAGLIGTQRHFAGNRAFELEMRPTLTGVELLTRTMTGATPALAPGALAFIGLVGLALTWSHPTLAHSPSRSPEPERRGP